MELPKAVDSQWIVAVAAALFAAALLAWEHLHGGVASHHLMDRLDPPAVSNWWALPTLPVLGWLASWSTLRRAVADPEAIRNASAAAAAVLVAGILPSVSFTAGHDRLASIVFLAAPIAGLVFRAYRAEYQPGFVAGMAVVFGATLPAVAALASAAISAASHFLIRPAPAKPVSVPHDQPTIPLHHG